MLVPLYVNEGVKVSVNEGAFESAKPSTNDCSLIPDKNHQFPKPNLYWKIIAPLSALDRSTLECVIFTTLVKCARNHHKMTHNSKRQTRLFNGARSHQIFEFSQKAKQYQYGSVEVPFYLSTTAFSTLEMMNTTTDTMQPGANCTRVEHRLPRSGKAH